MADSYDGLTVLDRFINRLTDNYNKSSLSNVYKTYQMAANPTQENEDVLNTILSWRDIDNAQGAALDIIGQNNQQNRGQTTDEIYRTMIKAKIKRNLSIGTIDNIIDFMSFILNADPTTIKITELWQNGLNAALHVDCPANAVNSTGLSLKQFGTLVNLSTAGGVRTEVLFQGTFSFSSQLGVKETDANAGFADVAQTTGGQLGFAYDPVTDYELPI